jgi:hypothetical protein
MSPASKRLLIAQYSGFGNYAPLLKSTATINKGYAWKWSHNMLVVQGTALVLQTDGPCENFEEKSMYNKIPILLYALKKRKDYDQVLILDADTLIYDFSLDVTTLLRDGDLLAAHRVRELEDERTWNINNGITLWDLQHPLVIKIAKYWFHKTVDGLNKAKEKGLKGPNGQIRLQGDQSYLHSVLRRKDEFVPYIRSLPIEFKYEKGTVIKHFVRENSNGWNNTRDIEQRGQHINAATQEICEAYPVDCEFLDLTKYTSLNRLPM